MKTTIALLAFALGASMSLQTANAADRGRTASVATSSQNDDVSAARKKRHRVYVYPAPYAYFYPRAYSYNDPSYQSPELIRLRALNRCVFDLGYGRWENCN